MKCTMLYMKTYFNNNIQEGVVYENKLIDFLQENGYYFAGTSDIETDDEEQT